MRTYRLSPAARSDLDSIWDYTVETWGEAQAREYVLAIRAACEALANGSRRGQAIDAIRPGYRKLNVGSHILFYRTTGPDLIDIIRILHGRMDIPGRLAD